MSIDLHGKILRLERFKMNAMMNKVDEMRVYVADLASYNNGILSGSWINLPCDDIWAEVQNVLDRGTRDRKANDVYDGYDSEEWAIHDYELPFDVGEYGNLDDINALAEKFEDTDESDRKRISYLIDYRGCSIDTALEEFEDVYIYEDTSYLDLAEMLVDETWSVPEHLLNYIDYEKFARELECDYSQIGNDLFSNQ